MVRQFAIVTGASTGIGYQFARICAREGYDLRIAADEVEIEKAAADLRREPGAEVVEALHLDLAKQEGIDKLHAAHRGPSDRRAHGECRPWTWASVSRSGPRPHSRCSSTRM